jgi:hypothetical protein
MFKGTNVEKITKVKQSDIFLQVDQTVVGTVNVPTADDFEVLPMGTLLHSDDGGITWDSLTTPIYVAGVHALDTEVYHEGHIYKSTAADNETVPGAGDWDDLGVWDANGVLYIDITETRKTTVVVTGALKAKYLGGYDEFLRKQLFQNKLLIKN